MVVLKVPALQGKHDADPTTDLYSPAAHAAHSLPSEPVYPALQTHSVISPLACGELVYVGHERQLAATASLYFPAVHGKQDPEPAVLLKVPAAQASH